MIVRTFFLLFAIAFFCAPQLRAQEQFVLVNGPYAAHPTHLVSAPNGSLFLFSDRHARLLRSTDTGNSWTMLRNGLPSGVLGAIHAAPDGTLYLGMVSPQGLFRSIDNGDSWKKLAGPAGTYQEFPVFASEAGGALYLLMGATGDGVQAGLHRSTDRGETWTQVVSALASARSLVSTADGALLVVDGEYYGGARIHRSTDKGATWVPVASAAEGMVFMDLFAGPGGHAWGIARNDYQSVPYHSTDNGATWSPGPPLQHSYSGGACQTPDGKLLVGMQLDPSILYRCSVSGTQWSVEKLSPGMSGTDYGYTPITVAPDGDIFAGVGGILFRSTDNGASWDITGATTGLFTCIAVDRAERVYVGVEKGGVMQSTDRGETWALASAGIDADYSVVDIASNGRGKLFAATRTGAGLYRSSEDDILWSAIGPQGVRWVGMLFVASNGDLYISASNLSHGTQMQLYRSADDGTSWTLLPSPAEEEITGLRMAEKPDGSLYLLGRESLYRSTDRGNSWVLLREFDPPYPGPSFLICANGDLLLSDAMQLYRSVDNGATWSQEPPIPGVGDSFQGARLLSTAPAGQLWMFIPSRKIMISYDAGRTWQVGPSIDVGLDMVFAPSGDIYLIAERSVYRGRDMGAWSRTARSSGQQVLALAAAANNTVFVSTFNENISISRNNGDQWFSRPVPQPQYAYSLLAQDATTILAGTSIGIFRSTDDASTWKHVSNAIPQTFFIHALLQDEAGRVYAGTFGSGVYRSQDGSGEWSARNNGLGNLFVKGLSMGADGHLFAATNGGVYRTTDGGEAWTPANGSFPSGFYANAVAYRPGRYLLAATKGGIYRSVDEGETWSHTSPAIADAVEIRTLYADRGGMIWAGCDAGIFSSKDEGRTWEPAGLGDKDVRALTENERYIFAGTTTDGVYRMVKAVASSGDRQTWEKSGSATLNAMPNPSGGTVTLRFVIPDAGHTTLELYDQLGSRVSMLLDADMIAGEHMLRWESNLPSGIYYCVLTSAGRRTMLELLLTGWAPR